MASQKPVRDPYDGTGLNEAPPNWVPSYFLLTWQVRPPGELHEAVELTSPPTPVAPTAPAGPATSAATAGCASSPPAVPVPALGGRHDRLTTAAAWSRQPVARRH